MRRIVLAVLALWLAAPPAVAAALTGGGAARVVEVVDGDTVVLATGEQVRMVGIQAPQPNFRLFHKMLGARVT